MTRRTQYQYKDPDLSSTVWWCVIGAVACYFKWQVGAGILVLDGDAAALGRGPRVRSPWFR